nr:MAG TPA: hypothetical protein [Caudoviricetes sp.]
MISGNQDCIIALERWGAQKIVGSRYQGVDNIGICCNPCSFVCLNNKSKYHSTIGLTHD